jgi:hypothetical protein
MEILPNPAPLLGAAIGAVGVLGIVWFNERKYLEAGQFWDESVIPYTDEIMESDDHELENQRRSHLQNILRFQARNPLRYEPLEPQPETKMRLISIEKIRPGDDRLRCTIRNVDIRNRPKYTALSYYWGKDDSRRKIILVSSRPMGMDEERTPVMENLYDALCEMRRRGIDNVWTDFLCINQDDLEEKNKQLLKMKDIYNKADRVVAWLGAGDSSSKNLINTLSCIAGYRDKEDDLMFRLMRIWMREVDVSPSAIFNFRHKKKAFRGIQSLVTPEISKKDSKICKKQTNFLQQILSMVQREYWRRVWILQEVAANGAVEFYCGQQSLDSEVFFKLLKEMENIFPASQHLGFWNNKHQHVLDLHVLRQRERDENPMRFLEALQHTSYAEATDPRDKIYALYGLCSDAANFVPAIDYKSSLEDIIRLMADTRIRVTRSLDIICLKYDTAPELPSWVPCFHRMGRDTFNHRMISYLIDKDKIPKLYGQTKWRASAQSSFDEIRYLDSDYNILCVSGRPIGTIGGLSAAFFPFRQGSSSSRWFEFDSEIPRRSELSETVQMIYDTLTIYRTKDPTVDGNCDFKAIWEPETLRRFKKKYPLVYQWLTAHRSFKILGQTLENWSSGIATVRNSMRVVAEEGKRVMRQKEFIERDTEVVDAIHHALTDGRRLMETEEGLVGWAHPLARPGDQIFLLAGCTMPVILRRLGRSMESLTYTVVGDAYLHGAMYGELWVGKMKRLYLA